MIRRLLLYSMLLSLCTGTARAGGYVFDYNIRCQQAYQAYLSLRISEGDALIRQEFLANPRNLMATYLSDYGDFIPLLFNGSAADLKQRQSHQDERLELLERADDREPWKDFCRAGIYLHWAVIRGWHGDQFKAATTFRKSYLLIRDNSDSFPGFSPNQIFLGMEEAVAGTIPDEYKWLAAIFGMKGNVRRGIGRLGRYLDTHLGAGEPLRAEAVLYYQYLRFYLLSQQAAVWNYVSSDQFPVKGNLLHYFVRANLALNYHKADQALQILKEASAQPGYNAVPALDYETGNALFLRTDPACITYFNRFLGSTRSPAFCKDALMKCALMYYLKGDRARADETRRQIGRRGTARTDADKQAQRLSEEGSWPHATLLQARLLSEGGYYTTALSRLQSLDPRTLTGSGDQLEYTYRLARALDETGDDAAAVRNYLRTISAGEDRKEQFAARAALQLGLLYEQRRQPAEALQYFRRCLSMRHHDFQSSLDQQAKAGVNRLSNN